MSDTIHAEFVALLNKKPAQPVWPALILNDDNSNAATAVYKKGSDGLLVPYFAGAYWQAALGPLISAYLGTSAGQKVISAILAQTTLTTTADGHFTIQFPGTGPLTGLINSAGSSDAHIPVRPTFTALTLAGATQHDGANPLVFQAGPPPYLTAQNSVDWGGGGSCVRWNLQLLPGVKGGCKLFVPDGNGVYAALGIRTDLSGDAYNFSKGAMNAGIFGGSTTSPSYLENGSEVSSNLTLAAGGYWISLESDGASLKAYYSLDDALYTAFHTFAGVNAATQTLTLGAVILGTNRINQPSYYGFTTF